MNLSMVYENSDLQGGKMGTHGMSINCDGGHDGVNIKVTTDSFSKLGHF